MLSVKKNPSFGAYFDELKKFIQMEIAKNILKRNCWTLLKMKKKKIKIVIKIQKKLFILNIII